MALPDLRVHSAGNCTPAPHDTDPYDEVEVGVVLQHLRGNPIASALPPVPAVPASPEEAESFLMWCGTHIGPGFHPDTRGPEYIHGPDHSPTFTPDQSARFDRAMGAAFGLVADPYDPKYCPPLPLLPVSGA